MEKEHGAAEVAFFAADNLRADGIAHGFFMRTGGVSEGIYASLNCGRGSSDEPHRVEENRARVAAKLGVEPGMLTGPRQVHSATALIISAPWKPGEAPEADAVVTNVPGLALSVLTADCAPVLLADREAGVIAAAHAGWRGAKAGITDSAIEAMESLGARPERMTAAVGPTISQAAYEVSPEFKAALLAGGEANGRYFVEGASGRPHFNLPAYVRERLLNRGVASVHDLGVCTYKNESALFSYRRSVHRSEAVYGRQISVIALR